MKNSKEKAGLLESLKFMEVMHHVATPGVADIEDLEKILEVAEEILNKRIEEKKEIVENLKKESNILVKEIEEGMGEIESFLKEKFGDELLEELKASAKEFHEDTMKRFGKIDKEKLNAITEKFTAKLLEEKKLNTYICTFGAGQENEGKYIKIHTESYNVAVEYMENKYKGKCCMVYPIKEWEKWVDECKKKGLEVETKLEEIAIVKAK